MWASLPPELISEIFEICVDGLTIQPETLSHINRVLRQVALGTPRLWNHIYYEGVCDLERCEAFLERSGQALLTLELNLSGLHNDRCNVQKFAALIDPHWVRVQDLRLAPYDGETPQTTWRRPEEEEQEGGAPGRDDIYSSMSAFYDFVTFESGVSILLWIVNGSYRDWGSRESQDDFLRTLEGMPHLYTLTLTTRLEVLANPIHQRERKKLGSVRTIRMRGYSLCLLARLETPRIRSIHLDMYREGAGSEQFQHFLTWLRANPQTLESIDIVNAQGTDLSTPEPEGNMRPETIVLPSLTRLNATTDPWSMAILLRAVRAPALTEVSLGLHPDVEHATITSFFEAVSSSLQVVRLVQGLAARPFRDVEPDYPISSPRIVFPELRSFVSELYIGGSVIGVTRAAPKLEILMLSGPQALINWNDPPMPTMQAPSLQTLIINGFSSVCNSINAPYLKNLQVLAVNLHMRSTVLSPASAIHLVWLLARFAPTIEHLELHDAIQGMSQTVPPPYLHEQVTEPLVLPELKTLYIMPYDALLEHITAPHLQILHLGPTSHASPIWARLEGASNATTLIIGSVFSDEGNTSSLRWSSLRNITTLRIVIDLNLRNHKGESVSLEKHIRRIQLLNEPMWSIINPDSVDGPTGNKRTDSNERLLPKLAHIEIHFASSREALRDAFNGVANGDPGYETDSSNFDLTDALADYDIDGEWADDNSSDDPAEYYSNSSAWDSDDLDDAEDHNGDDEVHDEPVPIPAESPEKANSRRSPQAEMVEEQRETASLDTTGSSRLEQSRSVDASRIDENASSRAKIDQLRTKMERSMFGFAHRPRTLEKEVDLTQFFTIAQLEDGGSREDIFRAKNTNAQNDRAAFGRIIHTLGEVARSRRHHQNSAPVETIAISVSESGDGDWTVPQPVVQHFRDIGVDLSVPLI